MSDSIEAQFDVRGKDPATNRRMVLSITLSSSDGCTPGALEALKTDIRAWAARFGVTADFDGPNPE